MAAHSQVGAGVVVDLHQEEEEEGEAECLHFQEEVAVVEEEEEALQRQVVEEVEEVEAVLQLEGAGLENQDLTQSL